MILPEAGAIYVMGPWYVDFARLYGLHQAGAFFVTPAKSTSCSSGVFGRHRPTTGVIADQTITLDGHYTRQRLSGAFSGGSGSGPQTEKTLCFLQPNSLTSIDDLRPVQKPLAGGAFLQVIKQHLRIKQFYGTSRTR